MIAVDTNVLIYAHRAEMELHGTAKEQLVTLAEGDEPWVVPVFCITEFLRVVTHTRVFNPPSTASEALDFLDGLLASPSCTVANPETAFMNRLDAVVRESRARGNLIFDAQVAALCREHGIPTILTNDRDFERFKPLRAVYLESTANTGGPSP